MPIQIPDYGDRKVRQAPLPAGQQGSAETPAGFGAGVGGAIAQAGSEAAQLHDKIYQEELLRADQSAVQEAERRTRELTTDLLWGDNGIQQFKGRDAATQAPNVRDTWEKSVSQITAGLTSDRQREVFSKISDGYRGQLHGAMAQYTFKEGRAYDDQEYKALQDGNLDAIGKAASTGDVAGVQFGINSAIAAAAVKAKRENAGPEVTKRLTSEIQSNGHVAAINAIVAADDAPKAQEYFDANRKEISGLQIPAVMDLLKKASAETAGAGIAQAVFSQIGPKTGRDIIDIAALSAEARKRAGADVKVQDAAVSRVKMLAAEFNAGATARQAETRGRIGKAIMDGASYDDIQGNPQLKSDFLSMSDAEQTQLREFGENRFEKLKALGQAEEDRAYTLQRRGENQALGSLREMLANGADRSALEQQSAWQDAGPDGRAIILGELLSRDNVAQARQEHAAALDRENASQAEKDAADNLWGLVAAGANLGKLQASADWQNANGKTQVDIQSYLKNSAQADTVHARQLREWNEKDLELNGWAQFARMSEEDVLSKMSEDQIRAEAINIGPTHVQNLLNEKRRLQKAQDSKERFASTAAVDQNTLRTMLRNAGYGTIADGVKNKDTEASAQWGRLLSAAQGAIRQEEDRKKGKIDEDRKREIMQKMVDEEALVPGKWLGSWSPTKMPAAAMTPEDRKRTGAPAPVNPPRDPAGIR